MSEIEVGECIRTNNGLIGKLIRIERDDIDHSLKWYVFDDGKNERYVNKPYITKHSKNIIDLIEPGDIVNNHYVKAVCLDGAVKYIKLDNAYSPENHFTGVRTYEEDIETILTKEQMEANQYVVKRNMETN